MSRFLTFLQHNIFVFTINLGDIVSFQVPENTIVFPLEKETLPNFLLEKMNEIHFDLNDKNRWAYNPDLDSLEKIKAEGNNIYHVVHTYSEQGWNRTSNFLQLENMHIRLLRNDEARRILS